MKTKKEYAPSRGPFEKKIVEDDSMIGPDLSGIDGTQIANETNARWKEMNPVTPGRYLFNEVGSIHKSYTIPRDGAFLVLWGGIHATIPSWKEGTKIPNSDLLSLKH